MKRSKLILLIVIILLAMPIVFAEDNNQTSSCSIFSPIQCLKDTAYLITYSTGLAAQPLIKLVETLMTAKPNIKTFKPIWLTIISLISSFYISFLLYSGIIFITDSNNLVKRHKAKESIKNMIIAIIIVSASYYLYNLLIEFNSSLTSYIFNQINPDFFKTASDSFGNAIMQLILIIPYIIVLLLTAIMFGIRWLLVSFGVILFPIGIFLYFVPFLKSYGKLIINIFILLIFISFISSIVILGSSMLINAPVFENFAILFYVISFLIVDFSFYLLIKFVLNKSGAIEIVNVGEAIAISI